MGEHLDIIFNKMTDDVAYIFTVKLQLIKCFQVYHLVFVTTALWEGLGYLNTLQVIPLYTGLLLWAGGLVGEKLSVTRGVQIEPWYGKS